MQRAISLLSPFVTKRNMAGRLAAAAVAAGLALAVTACGQASGASPASRGARPAPPSVAAAVSDPLACAAQVTNKHPRDHHTVGVQVQTVPHARVVTVAHFKKDNVRKAHRAGPAGRHTAVYPLYSAAPGFRVEVSVYVFRHGRRGTCTTSFTPRGAAPGPGPTPTPSPPPSALACTASMSDSTPAQHTTVDVDVSTSPTAAASATAHYRTTNTTHNGTADSSGDAAIPFNISDATIGFQVNVDVTVTLNGQSASCSTSFTPTS
jgi:hypothetical protein